MKNGIIPALALAILLAAATAARAEEALPPVQDDYADGLEGGPDFWEVTGVSAGDMLNLRARPSAKARILLRFRNGTALRNGGCRMFGGQRWCRVTTVRGPDATGWVAGRYLREGSYSQ